MPRSSNDSIRHSLASLDELEAWLADSSILEIAEELTRLSPEEPLLADRVGIDPAVVSAPFITTVVDATGLIIYFLIARAVLGI